MMIPKDSTSSAIKSLVIAVIIPFYQRDVGILSRALLSVLRQDVAGVELLLVIVDDGSPVDPAPEIDQCAVPEHALIKLIRQKNAGPAAARNTGLAFAEACHATHVAFLDSDDEWEPGHVSTALAALQRGSSFYFCDNMRFSAGGERNEDVGFDKVWSHRRVMDGVKPVSDLQDVYRMDPHVAFDELVQAYLGQTSTVVLDLVHHRGARFDEDLRGAGEDHLLWLELASRSTGVAFSTRCNVRCGAGVNLYFMAVDWAMPATMERFGYLALLYGKTMNRFSLTPKHSTLLKQREQRATAMFGYLMLKNVTRARLPKLGLMKSMFRTSPANVAAMPALVLRLLRMSPSERVAYASQIR